MGLFDNFGEKIQGVAKKSGEIAQTAAKKSGELIEVTKLNLKIKENESDIRKQLVEIGKVVLSKYENSTEEVPEEFKEFIDMINVKNEVIEELKAKIEEIKKVAEDNNIDLDIVEDVESEIIDEDNIDLDEEKL